MKKSKGVKRHRRPNARSRAAEAGQRGKGPRRRGEGRVFIGAWVPGPLGAAVGSAVQRLAFKNRSEFLRSILWSALEEIIEASK